VPRPRAHATHETPRARGRIEYLRAGDKREWITPPETSTRPSSRRTALSNSLGTFMLPVAVHVLVEGLNKAASVKTAPHRFPPPDTRTRPSSSRTTAGPDPTVAGRDPVRDHVPETGSYVSALASELQKALAPTPPTTNALGRPAVILRRALSEPRYYCPQRTTCRCRLNAVFTTS
jgi:hypothetical protein